jgi:hypothetical protein
MNVGDWVFFKTCNWPEDVQRTKIDSATGEAMDTMGQGLYSGRGKIVGIAGDNYTVREEKTNRLVEVGPHPDDQIRSLDYDYTTLTLGHLRAFLEQHKEAPDDIPVTVALPLSFFSDLDEMPSDHPEYKAFCECQSVDASGIALTALSEHGEMAERYILPERREGEEWDFSVEITPNPEQCFHVLREHEEE